MLICKFSKNSLINQKLLKNAQAGFLAQKRLARGLQLNKTETVALIASQLQERIRDGHHSVAELMQHGKTILGRRHVLPSVPTLLHDIQVEGTFHDGFVLILSSNFSTKIINLRDIGFFS